jgi:hypothetical protein
MAGIQDMLTDIRTTGQGVPMGGPPPGQPPMGGPPPGQPPMGRPPMGGPPMGRPPMGGGIASMGGGQPPMTPPPGMGGGQPPMGGGQPPMGGGQPPMEEPMSIEKDAAMLAEATMGRTGGDLEAAAAILQTATQMIMSVGQEDPMMGGGQDPMMMMGGGPMYRNMGGPMYAQEGMSFGDQLQQGARDNLPFYEMIAEEKMPDIDVLKEMIMNGLKDVGRASIPGMTQYDGMQRRKDKLRALSDRDMSGRTFSDRDMSGRTMSDRDSGRTLSNKDLSGRTYADSDANLYLQALREARKQ